MKIEVGNGPLIKIFLLFVLSKKIWNVSYTIRLINHSTKFHYFKQNIFQEKRLNTYFDDN